MSDQGALPPEALPAPTDSPIEVPQPDPFVVEVTAHFAALEANRVTFRTGVVTDDSPLSVALGGSATPYTSVNAIDGGDLKTGMTVGCLMLGTDLVVLGAISSNPGGWAPGDIKLAGYSTIPAGWLECDGASKATATYPDLFAAIGYTFGGSGANFNVPDLKGRAPVGKGTGSGLSARALAAKFGTETHPLTTAELAAHTHTGPSHTHAAGTLEADSAGAHTHTANQPATNAVVQTGTASNVSGAHANNATSSNGAHTHNVSGSTAAGGTGNTGSAGSGTAHANTQPSLVLAFYIKT